MASIMKGMSGKGMGDRMKMINELQKGGMMDPGSKFNKQKQSTGKRLSPQEKAKLRKKREKELRKKKRKGK